MKSEALHYRESKAGVFARCMLDALDVFRDPRAWLFALPQIVASALLLGGLLHFHRTPLNVLWAPLIRAIAEENALHYPQFFRELPLVFFVLESAVFWLLLPVGWAAFVHALPRLFREAPPEVEEDLRAARSRALRVWGGALAASALQISAAIFIGRLSTSDVAESPRLFSVAQLISFVVITLVQVLGAYVIPAIMLGNRSFLGAWVRSWELVSRSFLATTAFVLVPRLPEVPLHFVIARLPEYWGKLDPGSVGPLLAARGFVTVAGTFVAIAALTRFYLHVYGEDDS
ncbi:MAG TPA: hypothetical protein VFR10_11085 [bacterium]|nr:hypothetical protein [bacterium]